jgi:hypothetical protein
MKFVEATPSFVKSRLSSLLIVRWNPARELSHMDPASAGRFELQFEMASERPPAAFGGSPPHRGGE